MVRNVKGFTFVELMISMVILSIVLTIVTGTMVYISKRNSEIDESNHGYQIAKEKLIELQSGEETVASVGSDAPSRNGIDYKRSWEIVTVEQPYPVTVTVTWQNASGQTDSAVVVGYVNTGVCGTINGNAAPSDIETYNSEGTQITDNPPTFSIAKNGGVFVCSLYIKDKDTTKGDIVSLDFDPTGVSNDSFEIKKGNLLYSKSSTIDPKSYSVKLIASDCENLTFSKTINITITNDVNLVVDDKTISIEEHSSNDSVVATMSSSPTAEKWYIKSGNSPKVFDIDSLTGAVSVFESTKLDYDTKTTTITNPVELTIRGTKGGKEDTGVLTINLTGKNESPYEISIAPDTVMKDAGNGTVVGVLSGKDPENDALDYVLTGGATDAFELFSDTIKVRNSTKLVTGVMSINVTADDNEFYYPQDVNITVKASAASFCSNYDSWSNGSSYSGGNVVSHDELVWKATQWNSGNEPVSASTYWQADTICGAVDASVFNDYSASFRYNDPYKNIIVKYNGHLFVNINPIWGNLGMMGSASYWKDLGAY